MFADRHFHRSGRWHAFGVDNFALLNVETVYIGETTAQVRWTMSAVCTGQVEYGTATGTYTATTTEQVIAGGYSTHLQTLDPLVAGTTYYYRTKSTDGAGVTVYSSEQSFTTTTSSGISYTDYTVTTGVTTIAGLQAFLATVPDGGDATHHSRILLGAGRTYTGSTGLQIAGRNHLTFEGGGVEVAWGNTGGATIVSTGSPTSTSSMPVRSAAGATPADDMVFHCLNIRGSSTNFATTTAGDGGEYQIAFGLYGASNIEIDHVMADKVKGDFVYMADANGGSGTWCSNIYIHDSTISNNGRMGIAIIAANDVLIDTVRFTDICYAPFDIEPNVSGQGFSNVEITNCLIDGQYFSWDNSYTDGCFVSANASVTGITFSGYLRITDNIITAAMYPYGLNQWIGHFGLHYPTSANKSATLTITGNTCTAPKAQYACIVGGWYNGGTITDNTGFLTTGTWYYTTGGNGTITMSGNT